MIQKMNKFLKRSLLFDIYDIITTRKKWGFLDRKRYLTYEIKRKMGKRVLPGLFLSPSQKCQCNCQHCYELFNNKKLEDSLSTKEIKQVIDQFKKMDGQYIFFCSGEFILRDDCIEIIKYASQNNLVTSINTNGIAINEELIKNLKKAGLNFIVFSIDSSIPEEHDKLRGVKGCFDKAIKGIKLAKKHNLHPTIWTYISKSKESLEDNAKSLESIEKLAEKLRVQTINVAFPLLSGQFFNKREVNFTKKEREFFRKKFRKSKIISLEFPSENIICSGAGNHHINVNPSGEVTFCPVMPYSYGNVKKEPLVEIFERLRKDFKNFKHLRGQCPINDPYYRNNTQAKLIVDVENKL